MIPPNIPPGIAPSPISTNDLIRARWLNLVREAAAAGIRLGESAIAAQVPWGKLAFGQLQQTNNSVKILAGSIRVDGVGTFAVAETTVTLSGATEWIYVTISVTFSGGGTIAHSSTEPSSTTTVYRWPYYKFEATGSIWNLTSIRQLGGDVRISVPTR